MYRNHPSISQPNDTASIWRYMDFTKFVHILQSSTLYFSHRSGFDDQFEGSLTKQILVRRRQNDSQRYHLWEKFYQKVPNFVGINCWHENPVESAAMWKLYLQSKEGIAIKSTVERLKNCIIDDKEVYIGSVEYIDYATGDFDESFAYSPLLRKRKSFEHEREVRALVNCMYEGISFSNEDVWGLDQPEIGPGVHVQIDISILIESIYIAPTAPTWFKDLVNAVSVKFGYNFAIRQSEMGASPIY